MEEKVKEIRNIIDELPKDKPENLELEEVDCGNFKFEYIYS